MKEHRTNLKKMMSFIAIALIIGAVFLSSENAGAATIVHWYDGDKETNISVEKGAKFYIGDYAEILTGASSTTATLVKASYTSSNKGIATVNSKGYLNAKKAGTSDIIVSYNGQALTCHLTVEKKGSFLSDEAVTDLKSAAKSLSKGMSNKISNATKGFALLKKCNVYDGAYKSNSVHKLSYYGFLYEDAGVSSRRTNGKPSEKLAVPEALRYLTAKSLLRQYMQKNNPTSPSSSNVMQIASASASSKTSKITIKLKKKIDAAQILAAQLAFPRLNDESTGKSKADITMSVYDTNARKYYSYQLTLKKGSSQLTAAPVSNSSKNSSGASPVIVKGNTYMLESGLSWGGGYTLTAK